MHVNPAIIGLARAFKGWNATLESTEPSELTGHDSSNPLLRICRKLNSERDLLPLLDLLAIEATALLEADRASIFLLDREKNQLWSKVAMGVSEIIRFASDKGIGGAVVQTGQTINDADVHNDPRFYPFFDLRSGYQTKSLLAVPLKNYAGATIGVFEVLNKEYGAFTDDDAATLKALAAQAGVAIETAQLMEDLRRQRDQLSTENTQLWHEVEGKFIAKNFVGTSERLQSALRLIAKISDSSVNVLILGESGTGKELAAKAIHYTSPRARRPFVTLNCAALPDQLLESELFGIEKGVATGVEARKGKFEQAHGGTLFLDEVADLSLPAQAKLLRVLQEGVIEHVGGRKEIAVDVRVLSATNKDLEQAIKQGQFRQDLYYRLKVIQIHMPALREMADDIPQLANSFLAKTARQAGKPGLSFTAAALARMKANSWPGNVRELENEIKRLVASTSKQTIDESDLSPAVDQSVVRISARETQVPQGKLKEIISDMEKRIIVDTLEKTHYNRQQAALHLGLSRQGLIKKMKRYNMKIDT